MRRFSEEQMFKILREGDKAPRGGLEEAVCQRADDLHVEKAQLRVERR